eukprot:966386_1
MTESTPNEKTKNDDLSVLGKIHAFSQRASSKPIKLARSRYDPIDVYPWFEITVEDINSAAQLWHASIEIHLFWQDYTIPVLCPHWEETGFKLKDPEQDAPFKLSEIFENKVWERRRTPTYKYYPETSTIHMKTLVSVEFVERMELQRFPMDRQFLAMEFNGWTGIDPTQKRFNWNWILNPPDWVTKKKYRTPFAVRMLSSVTEYGLETPWIDFHCEQPLEIRLRVERLPGYYFGSIILPNSLICAAAFSALTIPIDDDDPKFIPDRLAVTVTLMLTAVMFKYVITEQLPKVTYLTLMDYYLNLGFIMLTVLTIENALSGWTKWSVDKRNQMDFWIGFIFGMIWFITHIFWVIILFNNSIGRIPWQRMDELDQEAADHQFQYAPKHKYKGRLQSKQALSDFNKYKMSDTYARVHSNSYSGDK